MWKLPFLALISFSIAHLEAWAVGVTSEPYPSKLVRVMDGYAPGCLPAAKHLSFFKMNRENT